MLHVVGPLSDVLVAVREDHGTLALLLPGLKVTLVSTAIFEREFAETLKHVGGKLTFVGLFGFSEVIDA